MYEFFYWSNKRKKVNILKWISPQENLFLCYLFNSKTCYWHFRWSSISRWFVLVFVFFVFFFSGNCFHYVTVILIPGFVSVNIQFELIVCNKLSSLQMLFHSFCFVFLQECILYIYFAKNSMKLRGRSLNSMNSVYISNIYLFIIIIIIIYIYIAIRRKFKPG